MRRTMGLLLLATVIGTAAIGCSVRNNAEREMLTVASDFMVALVMDDRSRLQASVPEETAKRYAEVFEVPGQGAGVGVALSWNGDDLSVAIEGQDLPLELSVDDSDDVPIVNVARGQDTAEIEMVETDAGWRVDNIDGVSVDDVVAGFGALEGRSEPGPG